MMMRGKEWYVLFSVRDNMLYINSKELTPNCVGMSFEERRKAFDEAYELSYMERLEK